MRYMLDFSDMVGREVQNMYENGTSYEAICDRIGLDLSDWE